VLFLLSLACTVLSLLSVAGPVLLYCILLFMCYLCYSLLVVCVAWFVLSNIYFPGPVFMLSFAVLWCSLFILCFAGYPCCLYLVLCWSCGLLLVLCSLCCFPVIPIVF
jgi:hypothetical protein